MTRSFVKNCLLITLLLCGVMLVCVGCEKGTGDSGTVTEFEIDNKYERGPLTAHVRVDKSSMTIAQTCLLELQAITEGSYQVQMPSVNEVLQHFGIVDWRNVGDRLDANDNVVRTYQYRLEPFLSGEYEFLFFRVNMNCQALTLYSMMLMIRIRHMFLKPSRLRLRLLRFLVKIGRNL
ncbi:MAG: hypothetical protein ACYSWP_25380 [Planctomycetota bacterium]